MGSGCYVSFIDGRDSIGVAKCKSVNDIRVGLAKEFRKFAPEFMIYDLTGREMINREPALREVKANIMRVNRRSPQFWVDVLQMHALAHDIGGCKRAALDMRGGATPITGSESATMILREYFALRRDPNQSHNNNVIDKAFLRCLVAIGGRIDTYDWALHDLTCHIVGADSVESVTYGDSLARAEAKLGKPAKLTPMEAAGYLLGFDYSTEELIAKMEKEYSTDSELEGVYTTLASQFEVHQPKA